MPGPTDCPVVTRRPRTARARAVQDARVSATTALGLRNKSGGAWIAVIKAPHAAIRSLSHSSTKAENWFQLRIVGVTSIEPSLGRAFFVERDPRTEGRACRSTRPTGCVTFSLSAQRRSGCSGPGMGRVQFRGSRIDYPDFVHDECSCVLDIGQSGYASLSRPSRLPGVMRS